MFVGLAAGVGASALGFYGAVQLLAWARPGSNPGLWFALVALALPGVLAIAIWRQWRRDRSWLDARAFAVGVAGPWIVGGTGVLTFLWARDWSQRTAYTATAWGTTAPDMRWTLADDLVKSAKLTGRTRDDVESELGPPDSADGWHLGSRVWSFERLVLDVGPDGRVSGARIERSD